METILGILIPFWGTVLGSCLVFFLKNTLNIGVEKILLGSASGVMIAASIWSLLIPSVEMAEMQGLTVWIPATIGFILGIIFLIIIDIILSNVDKNLKYTQNKKDFKNNMMLFLAVTMHNIPEGCVLIRR